MDSAGCVYVMHMLEIIIMMIIEVMNFIRIEADLGGVGGGGRRGKRYNYILIKKCKTSKQPSP